ncbi:MAG: hypothetical protein L0Y71_09555 [Gemmataceae bacterium]|nr:hypothetical protein [Gemmataceae bacterium]
MSDTSTSKSTPNELHAALREASQATTASFDVKGGEGYSEKLVDAIEMIGEEQAAGLDRPSQVTPGMRYLHSSRTIHQLVTDRNRAVGIYLAVASLLVTASSALFHARPTGDLIVPLEVIQRWCLPVTFGILTVLAVLIAFLLIRTRVGLIYEVAKMNALLGLPVGRVQRTNPLSIFFILQGIISLGGGTSAALFSVWMIRLADPDLAYAGWLAVGIGLVVAAALIFLYIATVNATTSDDRLQRLNAK